MQPEVVRLVGVTKAFNVGTPIENEVLHGIDLQPDARRVCRRGGALGLGQKHLAQPDRPAGPPDAGRLAVTGQETTELDDARLTALRGHAIGFVFQYHHLIGCFTTAENVMMPLVAAAGRPQPGMRERAEQLLASVGLAHLADRRADQLSGGQQQRVAVARSLAMQPACCWPTSHGQPRHQERRGRVCAAAPGESRARHQCALRDAQRRAGARCDRTIEVVDGRVR